MELVLPDDEPHEKILDLVRRPDDYAEVVRGIRRRLAEKYSYVVQFKQLIQIVES